MSNDTVLVHDLAQPAFAGMVRLDTSGSGRAESTVVMDLTTPEI